MFPIWQTCDDVTIKKNGKRLKNGRKGILDLHWRSEGVEKGEKRLFQVNRHGYK